MTDYLVGVDVGSSSCKVMLIDTNGKVLTSSAHPYPTTYPQIGWAEQQPEDWYQAACAAIRIALDATAIDPDDIIGMAIDGPAHNVALMDADGEVLYPTIHWSDLRSAPQCERLEAEMGDRIFEITNCRVHPSWTLSQLLWLKENRPDIWRKLRRILVTKDYVRYRFTGRYETDVYDAIGTQLYDPHRGQWSQALGELSSLSLENEVRVRDYKNVTREHFFQDFWETYFVGDLTIGVTDVIGTRVSGVFSKRDYQFHSATSLPDDSYWQVEPELFFNIGEKWKLGAGWHYGEQNHESASAAASPVSADAASLASITFEDYHEYGPIITIDFFELNGILFSLRQSFLLRRYPNTPTQNVDQFNLYTDRNSNSVLLFLTWPITSRWELNVLANLDDDRSQKDSSGDSQNTLLDVEISYSF